MYSDLEKQDPSLFKRLNYAKEILLNMINPNKEEEKNENKENPERTRPSTTKYSSSIGDSGATPSNFFMKSLE